MAPKHGALFALGGSLLDPGGPTELWPRSSAVPLPAQCMGPAAVHAWVPLLVSL